MTGDAGQHGAAIVDLADNESTDECQQGVLRQRTPHAADLSECGEAWPNSDMIIINYLDMIMTYVLDNDDDDYDTV